MARKNRLFAKLASDVDTSGNLAASGIQSEALDIGVTVYATRANLPTSGNTAGDQAYVTDNNRLYIWNGSGWYNIALLNLAPSITSVQDSDGNTTPFSLAIDGTPTTITITATDSDGDPIIYEYTADSDFNGLATLSQADNVFTITPFSQDSATTTSGTITFTATDGVNVASSGIQTFTLQFLSALWDETVLSIGTSSTNSLANSTFIDRSSNAYTVTTSGSPVQSALHALHDTWSYEFDGSNYLNVTNGADVYTGFGTDDFTFECWFYPTQTNTSQSLFDWRNASNGNFPSLFLYDNGGNYVLNYYHNAVIEIVGTTIIQPFTWYHVAVSRSSNVTRMFVNGTQEGGDHSDSTNYYAGSTERPLIGTNLSSWYFHGYMSNIRTVRGTAVYTSNFTPSTSNLTNITGTQILTGTTGIKDELSGRTDRDVRIAGTPQLVPISPFNVNPEYASGENKGSFYADGDDYLELSTADVDFVNEGSNFTIQGWVHSTSSQGDQVRWCGTAIGSSDRGFVCWIDYAGENINLRICGGGGFTDNTFAFTENVVKESWNHVAFCHDGSNLTAYWNGEKSSTSIATASVGFVSGAASQNLFVGRTAVSSLNFLNGYISDFKISTVAEYSSTFTPSTTPLGNTNARVYLPMDNAGIFDKTGNNTLTVFGNAAISTTQTKFASTSMYFDGTGDYITTDFPALGTSDFTIEFWINPSTIDSTFKALMDPRVSNANNPLVWIRNNNVIYYYASSADRIIGTTTLSTGTWYHVAVSRSNGTTKLFINGTQEGSDYSDTASYTADTLYIGQRYTSPLYNYHGYMENFQILNGVAKYTANFTPPTSTQGRTYQAES